MSIYDSYDRANMMVDNPLDLKEFEKYRIATPTPTKHEIAESISIDLDIEFDKLKSSVRKIIVEDAKGKRLEVLKSRAHRAYKNIVEMTYQIERICLPKFKHHTLQTNVELGVDHIIEVMEQEFLKNNQKEESDDNTKH